jgi:tetratricopeptide (TPR) repeat protein
MRLERGGPSEHLLRAANQARLAGDWTTALEQIDKALEVEETPQAISRLQWLRLRCLYFGGRRSLAMRTLQSVLSAGPPQTVEEWRLAIRLFPRHANPQFVLNTAVEAIRRYPADLDLLLQLERLCSRTGRWEVSRPVFETLASMPVGDDSYCQAARLLCLAGMAMRDRELALAGAQRIVARPELFAGRNEFLRAYAAAVLGLDADAKGDFSDALLRGARQRETNARIGVAAGCAALRRRDNEGLLKAVSRMDEFAAEASFGPAWRLAAGALYSLTEDWVACARQGLMQLACNVLRDRLRAGPARVHEIHAFALANLALSRGYREQPERSGAIFRDALGGWAALLGEEQWLGGFVEARLQVYARIDAKAYSLK